MDTTETEGKSSQIMERCRFWPACANGNDCQFVHPSVPCKYVPSVPKALAQICISLLFMNANLLCKLPNDMN